MVMNAYTKPRSDIPRGIPIPVLILLAVVVVMTFIARFTTFGRYVFAMGGNPEAAALSGINVKRTTVRIRSEEHTSELQSLMRSSYAVFCLKKTTITIRLETNTITHY